MTTDKLLDAIGLISDKAISEARESHISAYSADIPRKRITRPFIKWAAIAASFALVLSLGILGGLNSFMGPQSTNQPNAHVSPPHFMANDKMFWRSPNEENFSETLPEGYVECGAIQNILPVESDLRQFQNFDSVYGHVGDKIYTNPEKPDTAYLYSEMGRDDGKYQYLLFITQELRESTVFYNGQLYYDAIDWTATPWEQPDSYQLVGTIQKEELDIVPGTEFQSNIPDSLGCNVYVNKETPDTIYVEFSGTEGHYSMAFRTR